MTPPEPTPTPVGEQPFRRDEIDVPVSRRTSRMVAVVHGLYVASALFAVVPWVTCANLRDHRSKSAMVVSFALATALLIAGFVLERVARRRLREHPELSGQHRLARARSWRNVSAIVLGALAALIGSCALLLSQIDGRP